jgi:hypothetical protein
MLAQIFSQESDDPFLILVTLSHSSFAEDHTFVNNSQAIISRGIEFKSFPMRITLPVDDGESARDVVMEFDNVGLELIGSLRTVVNSQIQVKLEMILASMPDIVQMNLEELKIVEIKYDRSKIMATLSIDNFLSTGLTNERYTPQNFPGLF